MQGDVTGAITNIITGIIAGAVIILALAGCSGSGESDEPDQPAESSPPIRSTTVSVPTDAPALVPPLPTATQTPLSSITPVSASPAATTAITTVSTTSAAIPTETAVIAPTSVLVIQPTITPTPLPPSSPTAIAAARPIAQVCGTCDNLRLRETPGSAGRVMAELTANTPLTIIGRTQDNAWLQVVLNNGTVGWVASQYVESDLDLAVFRVVDQDITDAAVPAAPGAAGAAGSASVISGISATARQIFLAGQARGNRAGAFSKVGDSITHAPFFLVPLAGSYNLGAYGYLAPVLDFFAGPNGRGENCYIAQSAAAYPGWIARDLLEPGGAQVGGCNPGETPLECEYRTARPSVALIMIGTNNVGRIDESLDQYRTDLQRIVQISINYGVIPVLSTIPPVTNVPIGDRVSAINQIITATARAYDVPLLDYYRAMIALPGQGLSGDGVHPSEALDGLNGHFDADHLRYGYVTRNLTALQALYVVWQQVING